ncbi:MAG: hypothetical protein KIT76_16510, partial [Pseudolabrys sp.]|nr:hypothetical protein [Pseudolabrys sp.]
TDAGARGHQPDNRRTFMTRNRNTHMSQRNDVAKSARNRRAPEVTTAAFDPVRESARYVSASGDDPVPENMDVFRIAMVRRLATMLGEPRRCREAVCRRSGRCLGPTLHCRLNRPRPQSSPDETAGALAKVKRAIQRRLAELDAQRSSAEAAKPAPAAASRRRNRAWSRNAGRP